MTRKDGNLINRRQTSVELPSTCLVCNTVIEDTESSDCYNVFLAVSVTSHSKTQLAAKLRDIVGSPIDVTTVHSENLCHKCFMLVDEVDFHEKKASGLKMLITETFGVTLTTRHCLAQKQSSTKVKLRKQVKNSGTKNRTTGLSKEVADGMMVLGSSSCVDTCSAATAEEEKDGSVSGQNKIEGIEKQPASSPRNNKKVQRRHTVSEKGKKLECGLCGRSFSPRYLRDHIKTHSSTRPYICETCGETFPYQASLTVHRKSHSEERPHVCQDCGASFRRNQHLLAHLRIHSGERPFTCEICGKTFKIKGDLTVHSRVHNGEKPYKCDTCDRSFAYRDSYILHVRLHRDEKPFVCEQCGKRFVKSCDLTRHQRIHTGEKPYSCKCCGKAFTQNSTLKQHMKQHTAVHDKMPLESRREIGEQHSIDALHAKNSDKESTLIPENQPNMVNMQTSDSYANQFNMSIPVLNNVPNLDKVELSGRANAFCSTYEASAGFNSPSDLTGAPFGRPALLLPQDQDMSMEPRSALLTSMLLTGGTPL